MTATSSNSQESESSTVFQNVGSFVSSFFPVAHNEEEQEEEVSYLLLLLKPLLHLVDRMLYHLILFLFVSAAY